MKELPGFQKARPAPEESIRGMRGLALHIGRFVEFAHILFLYSYCSEQEPAREEHQLDAFREIEEEWGVLKEMSHTDDEELLIVLFEVLEKYCAKAQLIDNACLNEEVNNSARFDRMQFEGKFVKEVVPREEALADIIGKSKQTEAFDQIQALLMEGQTENKHLRGMD